MSESEGTDPTHEILGDRFVIKGELGRGGFSIVYEAEDTKLGQLVALKVLVPPPVAAAVALERLRREVRAIRSLSHPNIVTVYDLVEAKDRAFVVMERIAGLDLAALVAKRGALVADEVARLGAEIARALTVAHRAGTLHRDVKPQNVLIELSESGALGRARLVDFGSARLEGEASLTRTGGFVGTLDYAAPEVLAGERGDARSDVYGLGMTLFFALAGKLPLRASPHLPPPPSPEGHSVRKLDSGVPGWLDEVISRATREDRRARFPTTEAFAEALAEKKINLPARELRAPFCLLCGRAEPTRSGICRRCEGAPRANDGFIFIRASSESEPSVRAKLAALLGLPLCELEEVAVGRRALCASGVSADRVVRRLLDAGIRSTSVSELGAVTLLPPSLRWVSAAVAGVGLLTAITTGSLLGVAGPPLALTLLGLAVRSASRPLVVPKGRSSPLSPKLEARLDAATQSLDSELARNLLLDAAELGRNALEPGSEKSDPAYAAQIVALIEGALSGATQLARLDKTAALVERRKDRALAEPIERAQRARDALTQALLEVIGNLSKAAALGPIEARLMLEDLQVRNQALADEIAAREEALKELSALTS
ncbi:MAG: serine/threonine protein kinase [Deltaproteobacteria bacterium]|nr:serine/threonine protein kinase [Deltaproteobacteria bacterium]